MCSSENELIHDVQQVHLEELILKNEEQFVIVRLPLTNEQAIAIRREHIGGPILDPADMFARQAGIVGTPIPPCEDAETVGYEDESDDIGPLVRRTDMEAQVAKVAAEKDAEIAKLRGVLSEIAESDDIDNAFDPERNKRVAREAINEGSAI